MLSESPRSKVRKFLSSDYDQMRLPRRDHLYHITDCNIDIELALYPVIKL